MVVILGAVLICGTVILTIFLPLLLAAGGFFLLGMYLLWRRRRKRRQIKCNPEEEDSRFQIK